MNCSSHKYLLRETGFPNDDEPEESATENDGVRDTLSMVIVRVSKLTVLVNMLPCLSCQCATLDVRAINCTLGLVCKLETYCVTCDDVINRTAHIRQIASAVLLETCHLL